MQKLGYKDSFLFVTFCNRAGTARIYACWTPCKTCKQHCCEACIVIDEITLGRKSLAKRKESGSLVTCYRVVHLSSNPSGLLFYFNDDGSTIYVTITNIGTNEVVQSNSIKFHQ